MSFESLWMSKKMLESFEKEAFKYFVIWVFSCSNGFICFIEVLALTERLPPSLVISGDFGNFDSLVL